MVDYNSSPRPFSYDGGVVNPGEREFFRFTVSETYLGDPVRIPVGIINGKKPGPTIFLTAASHGDELNGIEVVREVLHDWNHTDVHGALVGIPVMNVPGFLAQERYLPILDRDLNRAFPGKTDSTSANRIAHSIFRNFIQPCDFGVDFHTSTRGRTNMFHIRADMSQSDVARLARSFGSRVILNTQGSEGTLRRAATEEGIPTITVEMGEAHRFERPLIDRALKGLESVFAEFGLHPNDKVHWPGWRTRIDGWDEKTWIRADVGGLVEMEYTRGSLVEEGETICVISNPFKAETTSVNAPFTGLLVGVLENPVVYPGNPICHLVQLEEDTVEIIRSLEENQK